NEAQQEQTCFRFSPKCKTLFSQHIFYIASKPTTGVLTATMVSPKRPRHIGNMILVLIQLISGLALTAISLTSEGYREISHDIYGYEAPLMSSTFIELISGKQGVLLTAALLLFSVWKERKINSLPKRAVINACLATAITALLFTFVCLLYAP